MTDEQWWTVGRWAAWTGAACFLVSSVIALLISSEATVPPAPHLAPGADLASFAAEALDWKRTAWPQGLAVDLLLVLGALTFVPLGLALRQIFGTGFVKQELMVSSFTVGAFLAVSGLLAAAGVTRFAVVSSANPDLPSSALPMMDILEVGVRSALAWLLAGFLSLMGIGVLLASLVAREQKRFSRGWAYVGIALAVVSWAAAVAVVARLGPAAMLLRSAVGLVLGPLWGAWLGLQLGRQPTRGMDPTPGAPI